MISTAGRAFRALREAAAFRRKRIDLNNQAEADYGRHRSDWNAAISALRPLHRKGGVHLDAFVERTFVWHPDGPQTHSAPWIGIVHVPPAVPRWFCHEHSNAEVFNSQAWQRSRQYCLGLFTLSNYHKRALERSLPVPIDSLLLPTEMEVAKWNWQRFHQNRDKKLIQIGWWLRRLYSIYLVRAGAYRKVFLRKDDADMDLLLREEREHFHNGELPDYALKSTEVVSFVPNTIYDLLLSENVVFVDLHDSSANNVIVECIARNTPILVNPLEAVVEYLGSDYPFYYASLEEAGEKAMNFDLVRDAHLYLAHHPFRHKFTHSYFRDSVATSPIYRAL